MVNRRPLTSSAIEYRAAAFRERYFDGVVGGIDLEPIIEHKLGIDIDPQPGLIKRLGYAACLSCTSAIVVDSITQTSWPESLYQQLIAHELGHFVLHRDMLPKHAPTRDEFVQFHATMPETVRVQLEAEARLFGRAVRMPADETQRVFDAGVQHASDRFASVRSPGGKAYVEMIIASYFDVPIEHAELRLNDLRLWRDLRRTQRHAQILRTAVREEAKMKS